MRLPCLLLSFLAFGFAAAQDSFQTFAKNDAEIGESSFTDPSPAVIQNLDILVNAVARADSKAVPSVLAKFGALAKKNDQGFATSFGWVAGEKMSSGSFTAVAVGYGPIGKVVLLEGGSRARDVLALSYMVQRAPHILHLSKHELIVGSQFVRDAGMRDNTKVQVFRINLGRAVHANSLTLTKTIEAEHTLEWGGAWMKGGKLVVESIDSPKSFILANTEAVLKHRRTYSVSYGELKLESDKPGDLALRAVDAWLTSAQKATRPNAMQKVARAALPVPDLLFDYKVQESASGARVMLETDAGKLKFDLAKVGGAYVVKSLSVK